MNPPSVDNRTLPEALLGDGRPPLYALALGLLAAGGAALFLAGTGHFLPHDEQFLGMSAEQLCGYRGCRVVHFMVHDRASFGGVVFAVGLLYLWFTEFPLRAGQPWAWWALLLSGIVGFASFLSYVGYGYLDAWHGAATLALLPCFALGLLRSWPTLNAPRGIGWLLTPGVRPAWRSVQGIGRACLLITALGVTGAGLTILTVGMTTVFVPQDLDFMGVGISELRSLNPRLVPLIAHDRAGFGGALLSCGVALVACIWCGGPSPSLWQVLALAGIAGFAPAIGVHFAIGYTDPVHLAPAVTGAVLFTVGIALSYRAMFRRKI
jgi:hypothetical protein